MTDTAGPTQQAASADATGEQPQGSPAPDTGAPADPAAEIEKWKSLARKHEDEAKKNRTAAQKLAEIEREKLTDSERAAAEREELIGRATSAEGKLARIEAAIEAGLDLKFASRLQGSTPEELLADAKSLLEVVGGTTKQQDGKPPANFDGGPRGDAPKPPADGNDALRQMYGEAKANKGTRLVL